LQAKEILYEEVFVDFGFDIRRARRKNVLPKKKPMPK
jgi:hypothetical protein